MMETRSWPLSELRVLDLSTEIAGPYCTKLLADAGADVIKLESPDGGDPLRRWSASGTAVPQGADGALFQYLNASKRSVTVDIETAAGRRSVLDLAATANITVESSPPRTMSRLGLSLDALQERNPGHSLVSITPWGQTGPWADRPATEFTMQAAVGSTAYRGLRDRSPVAAGGRIGEWATGSFAAVGAISAWMSASNTGHGQLVDVSMFEAVLLSMTLYHDLEGQWMEGPVARAVEIPSIEPAQDGWVGFTTITAQQWMDFCALIGTPELGEDRRFLNATQRMEQFGRFQQIIHAWTRAHTVAEIVELASAMRIPVAPIGDGSSIPTMDHFIERRVFVRNPGGFLQPRPPYRLEKAELRPLGRAPHLGEHTAEIAAEAAEMPAARPGGDRGTDDSPRPLYGVRIVDLTAFWAGPIATCYLAAMGADVVKIESIQRPDGMRLAGVAIADKESPWEWSSVFAGANPSKRSVTLRLDCKEGIDLVRRLIATADVVTESYSARVLEHFDLGWDTVRTLNPRAIMVRMPAFGLSGPWRDRTGFAMTLEQVSGLAWMTGYRDMPLVVRGACDPIGGMHAVFALLLALEHRKRTGEGQLVEVPLVECALNIAAEQVIEHSASGALLCREENRGPGAAPQGVYRCAKEEDFVALAVVTDTQWRDLCALMGNPAWAREPKLRTRAGRRGRHDDIDGHLQDWLAAQEVETAVERLLRAGIPAARAINAHYVMPNPQLSHRRFFETMTHPVTGETRYPGFPMRFSRLGSRLHRCPPPTLGQDNDAVLGGELGLSAEDLATLRAKKVIGSRPSFL